MKYINILSVLLCLGFLLGCSNAAEKANRKTPIINDPPPFVESTIPQDGDKKVQVSSEFQVVFNEAMDSSTFTPDNVKVYRLNSGGSSTNIALAPGTAGLLYDAQKKSLKIKTADPLEEGMSYRVELFADQDKKVGIKDEAGNVLTPYPWQFKSDSPYTIGGTVKGLVGTLVLQNNKEDDLTLNIDAPFTFSSALPKNAAYDVTIAAKPEQQDCTISNEKGIISEAKVTNITVFCWSIGALDTTFNTNGMVNTTVGSSGAFVSAMSIQTDGKIVVAGSSSNGTDNDFVLVRYNTDGSLDDTFDGDGKVITSVGTGDDYVKAISILADGKIVVAGNANYPFVLVRYNSNGTLDNTFDGDGKFISSDISGRAMAFQKDGKIIRVWESGPVNNNGYPVIALSRHNSDGTLDRAFGNNGTQLTAIGTRAIIDDYITSVAIQSDDKIVLAGKSYLYAGSRQQYAFVLLRYNANGMLDTTFDGDGIATHFVGFNPEAIAIQRDDKIVTRGYGSVVRNNTDGSLDNTFNGNGRVILPSSVTVDSMTVQSDDKIVVVGGSTNSDGYFFNVIRYNPDGGLDKTFGSDGVVNAFVGGRVPNLNSKRATAVAIQGDGKIVAAGGALGVFTLVRCRP